MDAPSPPPPIKPKKLAKNSDNNHSKVYDTRFSPSSDKFVSDSKNSFVHVSHYAGEATDGLSKK